MIKSELDIEAIAIDFERSEEAGVPYPPAWFDRLSMDDASLVQLALLERKKQRGEVHAGWKVGLTAEAIQQQFNVHEPLFGYLLSRGLIHSGTQLAHTSLVGPGIENEICMRLGSDLVGSEVTAAEAAEAIVEIHPALELIETRGDFRAQLAVSVADNIQQSGFVIGDAFAVTPDFDLRQVTARVMINDIEVASGSAAAVLGNPINSLVWLSRKLSEVGRGLKQGDYVMSGSLTRQFELQPGDHVRTEFDPIGAVELTLT
ncbi:MAG: fumarylacetoacetate hydrolase family protein [Ilumatobacteraceae bacterium]|nr:fumarylacetoacetate hydrolase family protein [Ilumatobacteraceae bacterium]